MLCECHSLFNVETEQLVCNNYKTPRITAIKLKNETTQTSRSFDTFHLIFYDQEFNVSSMFLSELSYLFPRSSLLNRGEQKLTIKVILSFHNFLQLHFEDYSFYQLFGENSDFKTSLTLELTSNGEITFSSMALSKLTVDSMFLHASALERHSFEEIFNNTNIGELTIEGSTPQSNDTLKQHYNGKIQLAKFTKMVDMVSSEEFPSYPVRSMIIEAHEARRINASTFMNYRNLHGLHLIRPKFSFDNRSFEGFQYTVSLEIIELDAETIKDHTFQHASRIRFFTLGQNTRYLSEHSLDHLDYLTNFHASKIILDQLYPSSRCVLARFIEKQLKLNPSIVISPPQAEYCDCIHDFILGLLNKKPDKSYIDSCSDTQQERCQFSECSIVKNFRSPLIASLSNQQTISSFDDSIVSVTLPLDTNDDETITTHRLPPYVHRHPPAHHQSQANNKHNRIESSKIDTQDTHVSALKANEPIDSNEILSDDYDENIYPTSTVDNAQIAVSIYDEERRIAMKNETLKWITLSLICITILCLLLVATLIWFFTCRPSKQHYKAGFQPVLPNATNV